MRLLLTCLLLLNALFIHAQSNTVFGFSLYTGAGIHSYAQPVYERLGTTPTGNSMDFGLAFYRVSGMEKRNTNKLYAGIRLENMNQFSMDFSSQGGTHIQTETDQRAMYFRLAFVHEHSLNKQLYLPLKINTNFLLGQRHSGYTFYHLTGQPETYSYFTNTEDDKRKPYYFTAALGLGYKLPYGLQLESLIEPGTSPHADYRLFLGASLNLSWNIGVQQTKTKD